MKLYIETSVPNMLFHDDAPDKQQATKMFFQWVRMTSHEVYTSRVTYEELADAPEPKRTLMVAALANVGAIELETGDRELALAEAYVQEGALPVRYLADALHAATAVCHRMDVVVSWNMRHLVNLWRVRRINAVNLRLGWPTILVHTPEEVVDL